MLLDQNSKKISPNNVSEHGRGILAKGYTSTTYYHDDPFKVIKVLEGADAEANFENERRAYERLSTPDRPSSVLQFFGTDEQLQYSLVLERAFGGDLYNYIWHNDPIDTTTKCRWARQAIEALAFVHSQGILHCDVHAVNFFLDSDYNLKLGDFDVASIDGGRPRRMYRSSHQLWLQDGKGEWRKDCSVASDIFALGCVLYNIETRNGFLAIDGKEIEKDDIVRTLKERRFPGLSDSFVFEKLIRKCWAVQYKSMVEVLNDVPRMQS